MSTDLWQTLQEAAPKITQDDPMLARSRAILAQRTRGVAPPRRHRLGRKPVWLTVGIVAVATAPLVAASIATSSDDLPRGFAEQFADWELSNPDNGSYGIDPDTAVLLGTIDGPAREQLHVYATPGAPWCMAMDVYVPGVTSPNPYLEGHHLSYCRPEPAGLDKPFGQEGSLGGLPHEYRLFAYDVAGATHVELHLPDGSALPTLVHENVAYGWIPPASDSPQATLVGYDSGGAVLGEVEIGKN
ncbi:hypothetical protein [Isoptericola sp. NPDC056134]|uniref:hypothetical protein n=1 Tax=Isoptericola sp. NPDC056134 TaxID=3345723 RepID=UPI0035EC349A